jgi:hypothetical protein
MLALQLLYNAEICILYHGTVVSIRCAVLLGFGTTKPTQYHIGWTLQQSRVAYEEQCGIAVHPGSRGKHMAECLESAKVLDGCRADKGKEQIQLGFREHPTSCSVSCCMAISKHLKGFLGMM